MHLGGAKNKKIHEWAVVVVKWSASSPSTPTIRVWILLTLYEYEKTKINEKEARVGPSLKNKISSVTRIICRLTRSHDTTEKQKRPSWKKGPQTEQCLMKNTFLETHSSQTKEIQFFLFLKLFVKSCIFKGTHQMTK